MRSYKKCSYSEHTFKWGETLKELKTISKHAFVHPLASHTLFKGIFKVLTPGQCYYDEIIDHPIYSQLKYTHIPVTDMINDLMFNIHWTGKKRFNPNTLSDHIYKVEYSLDTHEKGCIRILTHGNINRINLSEENLIKEIIKEYYLTFGSIYRFFFVCGKLIYPNATLFTTVTTDECLGCSVGFTVGRVKRDKRYEEGLLNVEQVGLKYYFYNVPVVGGVLDVMTLEIRPRGHGILPVKVRRQEINAVFSDDVEDREGGMFLLIKPYDSKAPPLAARIKDKKLLPELLSRHSLFISILIAQIANQGVAHKECVKSIYEYICNRVQGIVDDTYVMGFDDVLNSSKYFIRIIKRDSTETLSIVTLGEIINKIILKEKYGEDIHDILRKVHEERIGNLRILSPGLKYLHNTLKKKGTRLLF